MSSNTYNYAYDPIGNRLSAASFVHWNLIQETTKNEELGTTNTNVSSYLWGLDLSGSMQGAGGIGGLLATVQDGQIYFSCFDANGNLTDYVDTNGTVAAHYEYGPFGETITATGSNADDFRFRFSTKYLDETGLYYYGYRYYSPELGRWPNRDPIGEKGGLNVYATVGNSPVSRFDVIGLSSSEESGEACCGPDVTEYVGNVLSDVTTWYGGLSDARKKESCQRLITPSLAGTGGSENAWDIVRLARLGFVSPVYMFAPARQGSSPSCKTTVKYAGACYESRDVNYLMWGKMMSLCGGTFSDGESDAGSIFSGVDADRMMSHIDSPSLARLMEIYLAENPGAVDTAISDAISAYEDHAYTLEFAVHMAYARKMVRFSGAAAQGAAYFTSWGYTGSSPSDGATYSMMDLSSLSSVASFNEWTPSSFADRAWVSAARVIANSVLFSPSVSVRASTPLCFGDLGDRVWRGITR
jgi:RHS repeat-associated protein